MTIPFAALQGTKKHETGCLLTVSNLKLDDVFSDIFGKAATAITTHLLENPSERITDVSGFRTRGMKATDEEALAAVDGECRCSFSAHCVRSVRKAIRKSADAMKI